MKASFIKRFLAYLVDIILATTVLSIVSNVIINKENNILIRNSFSNANQLFLERIIDFNDYFQRISNAFASYTKENIFIILVNLVIIVVFFIVIPYFNNGKTIGKKLFKIKTIRNDEEDLTINDLFVKNIFVNGLVLIIAAMLVYILEEEIFFILIGLLAIIQILLGFITIFMILFKEEKLGLHDIISKTKVVNYSKGEEE